MAGPENTPKASYKADHLPEGAPSVGYKSLGEAHAVIRTEMGVDALKVVESKEAAYRQTHGTGPEVDAKILTELNKELQERKMAAQGPTTPNNANHAVLKKVPELPKHMSAHERAVVAEQKIEDMAAHAPAALTVLNLGLNKVGAVLAEGVEAGIAAATAPKDGKNPSGMTDKELKTVAHERMKAAFKGPSQ
jgi:hypothetical protein